MTPHQAQAARVSQILRDNRRRRHSHADRAFTGYAGPALSEVLPTGAWAGARRCFVIGGGPSLRGFDFGRLAGELVIGVNRAFEVLDPAVLYSMDLRFLRWVCTGTLGAEATERFVNVRATKAWLRDGPHVGFESGIYRIDANHGDDLTFALEDGFCRQNNSGFGALNLALCLGCPEVYLLGFDMHGEAGMQQWWHDGYPVVSGDGGYRERMIPLFEQHAPAIREHGTRVVNLSPDSALKCFEFGRFDDIEPGPARPLVVAYATRGTGYEAEAERMAASAHRMGLDAHVELIDSLGGWQRNTQYKARFLRDVIRHRPCRSIVYTDADSVFVRYPALFDEPVDGIGYHLRNGHELLSGTLHLACNEATAALMDLWVEECERQPDAWDQRTLQAALARWNGPQRVLPEAYCCIFDSPTRPAEPVVLHMQASRRLKREVGV
jgi:hypothetical protein